MTAYREWFRVAIEHAYHGDGGFDGWHALPAAATSALMARAGVVTRRVPGGFALFAPGERLDLLPAHDAQGEPLSLLFHVMVDNPHFAGYTVPQAPPGQVLLADSRGAVAEPSGAWRLHAADCLGAGALVLQEQMDVGPPARMPSPWRSALLLRIAPGTGAAAPRYVVRLAALACYWKYYLLGALATRTLAIVDMEREVAFNRLDEDALGDRPASVFLSDRAIALRERSARRFQLREQASFGDKVLMKRLPVACAGIRRKAQVDGHEVLVSEIFVNY